MDPDLTAALRILRGKPKFVPEVEAGIYTGLQPEADRLAAERSLNELIDRLAGTADVVRADDWVLRQFAATLSCFPGVDTEDRERMCMYLEEIMDIIGMESSNGLLNGWLYGDHLGALIDGEDIPPH